MAVAALLAESIATGCHFENASAPGLQDAGAALLVRGDSILFLNDVAHYSAETPGIPDRGPRNITWTSSDGTVVSVNGEGIVHARRIGTATLTATLTAPDLVAPLTRSWPVRVVYASIGVGPVDSLTGLGERRTLVVRGLDVFGTPDSVVPAVLQSRDTTIVSVVDGGEIEARGAGVTTVVATYGGLRDSVPVRVRRVAARLALGASRLVLPAVGRDTAVSLEARDTHDSLIPAPSVRWTSSDPTAISVSADGTFRALRAAPAILSAQIDAASATLDVTVDQVVAALGVGSGDGQIQTVGAPVPVAPSVVVRDAGGYPIAGVNVVFSVGEGGGTVSDSVRTTGADGIATVGGWTLGTRPGVNRLLARTGGLVAVIAATAGIGPAHPAGSLLVVASDSVTAGGSTVVTLYARDAFGNPIATGGATVGFSAAGGTSTGQLGGTVDAGDGTYTTRFTARGAGSPTTIAATLNGQAVTSPRPTITVVPGPAVRLTVLAGNGQVAAAGARVPIGPVAGLFDALDNPVPGIQVAFAPAAGDGVVTGGVQTTDAYGRAGVTAWTLGSHTGEHRLSVTANALTAIVTATATPGAVSPAGSAVSISTGLITAGSAALITLQARDALHNPIGTGGATVVFSLTGGTSAGELSAVTDHGNGTYTATFTGRRAGSPTTVSASIDGTTVTAGLPELTVVAAAPERLGIVAGAGQTATVGTSVADAPAAAVYDGFDNPVPGVPVSFAVAAGGGSVLGGGQSTDATGRARVTAWTLGQQAGANVLAVTAGQLSASVTATGVAGPASAAHSRVTVAGGDTLPAGTSTRITLQAYDRYGNPLTTGGLAVGFTLSGGTSTGSLGPVGDNGDGSYHAVFTGLGAGTALTVGATADGGAITSPLTTLTVVPGAPARLTLVAGDGQQATVGTAVPIAPTVSLADAVGNPIAGATVTFEVTAGGGSVTRGTPLTDQTGRAGVAAWRLGPTVGEHLLTATAQSVRGTFTATAMAGPASPTASLVAVPQDTVAVGESVGVLLRAYDAFGNPVRAGGATVTFFLDSGTSGGTFAPTIDRGDGTYVASFTAATPGTPSSLRAVVDGARVTTEPPTLTVRGAGTRWRDP